MCKSWVVSRQDARFVIDLSLGLLAVFPTELGSACDLSSSSPNDAPGLTMPLPCGWAAHARSYEDMYIGVLAIVPSGAKNITGERIVVTERITAGHGVPRAIPESVYGVPVIAAHLKLRMMFPLRWDFILYSEWGTAGWNPGSPVAGLLKEFPTDPCQVEERAFHRFALAVGRTEAAAAAPTLSRRSSGCSAALLSEIEMRDRDMERRIVRFKDDLRDMHAMERIHNLHKRLPSDASLLRGLLVIDAGDAFRAAARWKEFASTWAAPLGPTGRLISAKNLRKLWDEGHLLFRDQMELPVLWWIGNAVKLGVCA